jgi:hypothetical protein
MCRHYLAQIQKGLPECQLAYRDDYAKIYSVMMDKPLVSACLKKLDNAITSKPQDARPETNWLRFSSILSHFEKKCWFPEDILLPLGVLDAGIFYFYIRRGYVLKDYGAGVKHGEFTHRLQWHVLMRVITEDFTKPFGQGWDHSPLELYVSLGMTQNRGSWGVLLDRPGDGGGQLNHPDAFHQWVLNNSNLLNIVNSISKRETKRRAAFVSAIYDFIDYINSKGGRIQVPREFFTSLDPLSSHDAFKQFDLWFAEKVLEPLIPDRKKRGEFYDMHLNAKGTEAYRQQKTTQASGKHRTKPYGKGPMGLGPVYSLSAKAIMHESDADIRAKNSRTKLLVA